MNRSGVTGDVGPAELIPKSWSGSRICAPGNVRGSRKSATSAVLRWDEPYSACHLCPDAIGYEVSGDGFATINVTRPPCEITGLKADVEYLFAVTAKAAGNNVSSPSLFRLPKMIAPGKPGTPELSESGHASVILNWTPAPNYGEDLRYRVYLNGFLIKVVDQQNIKLTHLKSHTDYRAEVRAVNAAGVSEPSFIAFKTRLPAPANLRFSHVNGQCRLAWNPMFGKYPSHEVSINGKVFTTVPGRWGYSFRLVDLSPGPVPHHFKFEVRAQLDGASSEISRLEKTLTDDVPPSRPGKPVVSDITDTTANMTWEASSDNEGVSGYRVVLNGLLHFNTVAPQLTLRGMSPGAYHYVLVFARDADGNLSDSAEVTVFKTTGQAPKPPPSTSVKLGWYFEENSGATGIRIMINDKFHLDILTVFQTYTLNKLMPGNEYKISVSSFDLFGQLSEPVILTHEPKDITPPSTPANLRITDSALDSVTFEWDESIDDIGICEYVIYSNHEYFDSTPLTQYTAVDLMPGEYTFEVCAVDLSGNASEPAAISVQIEGKPSSAPTDFKFSQTGLIPKLEWDAPSDMEDVIRYKITLSGPQGGTLPYETANTFFQPILLPRTRYSANITAINAIGRSLPLIAEFTTK
jgi:hypothetical protein